MTDHLESLAHKPDPNLDRMLFFSDGVFAIAITLLSIELRAPEGWDGSFQMLWSDGWRMLSAFAVSFMVIGGFWNGHRRIFAHVQRFDPGVFVLNLALLAAVALLPFATSLIYEHGPHDDTLVMYLALVTFAGVIQGLVYGWAAFVARSLSPEVTTGQRVLMLTSLILTPLAAAGMSLALVVRASPVIGIGLGALFMVLLFARRAARKKLA